MQVYLDNAATTPLSLEVKDYLISILDEYGNPSSLHSMGVRAKEIITKARKSVAKFINANQNDIIFTSGGSASNTLAIKGYTQKNNCTLLYSQLCHKSILECVKSCENAYSLKVDSQGFLDIEDLKEWLDARQIKPFVVLPYADSEIGTIQDVRKIIKLVHFYNGIVYLDCTGSISTIPIDVKSLDADMIGFSGHKLGALKGIGVLYKKSNIELEPIVYGSQGLFAGTENVLGIASIGKVVESYNYDLVTFNRNYVYNSIIRMIDNCYLVGSKINRISNNLYMCFKGIEGESLMMLLDMNGIQVSTGSACSSGDLTPSSALLAIGMNKEDVHSCIRFSFSGSETREELDHTCDTLKKCINILRGIKNE